MRIWAVAAIILAGCQGEVEDTDVVPVPPTRCEALGYDEGSFEPGGDGSLNALAGDFDLLERGGQFVYSANWSGCDSLVFILDAPRQNGSFSVDLWAADHAELLARSPDNVHYFFVPGDGADVEARLDTIQIGMNQALVGLDDDAFQDWQTRLHYVTETPSQIGGWLGAALQDPRWGIVIDREQRVRYVGSYADLERYDGDVGWFAPNLSKAANEARYANFTYDRQKTLDAEEVTEVDVWTGEVVQGSGFVEVTLPDAATMATFDTLEYDLNMECVGEGEFGTCPPWDYLVYMYQCDDEVDGADQFASTPCQQRVEEVQGVCVGEGTTAGEACTADLDCDDGTAAITTCDGYVAPVAAERRTGACNNPMGEPTEGTYTCNADGTGFEDLSCPCGTETGRWITTYHREGRWVHDATPFLAFLKDGGTRRFRFYTSQPYELDLSFRLSNRGTGLRPTSLTRLYRGSGYGANVNDNYQPMDVDVPSSAEKVELVTVVSGHGGGGSYNCAEFCRTTNHFFVNGTEFVIEDEWVDVQDGCEQQVDEGTVPNQYGTWWYGRNGWCPGKEVAVERQDITSLVTAGTTATFDHETFGPNGDPTAGGTGRIEVESWMAVYE